MKARRRNYWRKATAIVTYELHANATPLRAAVSLSVGILIGFTPFYGFHIITLLPLAFMLRLNRPLALLGVGATALPLVPLWIAAGIFTGKLVIPIAWCERVVDLFSSVVPEGKILASIAAFSRRFFSDELFDKLTVDGHDLAAGFIQWALGSCVLAVVAAAVALAVTYPLFLRIAKVRVKKDR
ncbi:MAG: DUF2062 domain-containing protein [Chitinispirillaceae bacterium]|nr:DUF2062 domain-containing protein [Chitinispirillaceae bacterium]